MKINKEDITVFVIDDEYVIRDSLTLLIEGTGLTVKSFDSAISFLDQLNTSIPACIVGDIRMPYMDGLELQEQLVIKKCDMPIIFMSGHADISISATAFRAGAVDFIEKPFEPKFLLQRLNECVEKIILDWPETQEKNRLNECYSHLTPREKEVFLLTVNNHSNKQAAKKLGISNRTVDVHRAHTMEKMQADSLNTLIIMAVKMGLL